MPFTEFPSVCGELTIWKLWSASGNKYSTPKLGGSCYLSGSSTVAMQTMDKWNSVTSVTAFKNLVMKAASFKVGVGKTPLLQVPDNY